jgi:hypothetical protein
MYTIDTLKYEPLFGNGGRFCNYFFRNMIGSILAKKYNLKAIYKYQDLFDKLNIKLYSGDLIYNNNPTIINNNNIFDYLHNNFIIKFVIPMISKIVCLHSPVRGIST